MEPRNWATAFLPDSTPKEREARRQARADLEDFFEDQVVPEGRPGRRTAPTDSEIEAIEAAIGPDECGRFRDSGFAPATRWRNWICYGLARYGGLRRSEVLKLRIEDLPVRHRSKATGGWALTSAVIEVVRRPDDPADPRASRPPSVKRHDRPVVLPDSFLHDIWNWIETVRPRTDSSGRASPYLVVTDRGHPLSVDRLGEVIEQAAVLAAREFEARHPGAPHTLDRLTWHRLRHRRAQELLPEYEAAGPTGLDEFREYFGWASMSSAEPYLRDLYRSRAAARREVIESGLAGPHPVGDGKPIS